MYGVGQYKVHVTFTEMSQKLINVIDVTEVFDVVTDECRHCALVNAETTVNTSQTSTSYWLPHTHTHTNTHLDDLCQSV